jgi:glutamate-1-semialdehyde 2,1-aminomutase
MLLSSRKLVNATQITSQIHRTVPTLRFVQTMPPSAATQPTFEPTINASKLSPLKPASTNHATAQQALEAAKQRFTSRNPTSLVLHTQAVLSLPGGNTRSLLHNAPFPVFMRRGTGYQVISEDGRTYTDLVGELTAGLFGHSNKRIHQALKETLDDVGLSLGATTKLEAQHAQLICERFGLERLRFTNSGTEANLHAVQAARRFTGKRKVVVFTGGYHGAVFCFSSGQPAPNNVDLDDWVVAEYNNIADAKAKIEESDAIAAVLVEGMQGAGPCIVGTDEFLHAIQDSAKKAGAVFILDEVMTSRLSSGGLQAIVGLKPDLTSFGKYLGGGITFGCFGGRRDIMSVYDPRDATALAHSGTFNNNTLGLAAGYVGLSDIWTPEVATAHNAAGDELRKKLQAVTEGTKMTITGRGSILGIHLLEDGKKEIASMKERKDDMTLKELFWFEMIEEGFWITRRGSIALILGTPESEYDRLVESVKAFLRRYEGFVRL